MRTIRFEALRGRIRSGRLTPGSAILLACVALVSAACSSSASPSTSSPPVSPSPSTATSEAVIGTTQTPLGAFLTADNGRTVYLFEKDTGSKSTCSGSCAAAWPPVTTSGMAATSGTANASLLGTTTRSDGTVQVTYAGHPIYFYTADTAPGQTNGEGVDAFGAEWYVVSPAGKKVENDED